jgi:hypothetical protein
VVRPRRISDFKPLFTNLAQTSHFQVIFGGLPPLLESIFILGVLVQDLLQKMLDYCAILHHYQEVQFATAEITGNFTGVNERVAHRRIFTEIGLEFYVDRDYRQLKFIEHWMEFISSGNLRVQIQLERDIL